MNIYGAAVLSTGLSLILINNYSLKAIAKETLDFPTTNCHQIDDRALAPTKTIPVGNTTELPYLIASTKTPPDSTQSSFSKLAGLSSKTTDKLSCKLAIVDSLRLFRTLPFCQSVWDCC